MSGTTIADESFETATSLPARAGSGLPGEGDVATDQCDRRKHCADLAPIHRPCMRPGAQSWRVVLRREHTGRGCPDLASANKPTAPPDQITQLVAGPSLAT